MSPHSADARNGLAKASVRDTLMFMGTVLVPTLGKGVFIRRPKIVALAERLGLDTRAVRCLQRLRRIYGSGPLILAIPGRRQTVLLSSDDVHRVLDGAPEPFAPATLEKISALAHFEPKASLASGPPERAERRHFHDEMLESDRPVHSMADAIFARVEEEAWRLLGHAGAELTWPAFTEAWHRAVRRVILGDGARDDAALTNMLAKLRGAANWAFLHPGRPALRQQFHRSLGAHLARAEPGSLAARIAARPNSNETAAVDQVTHWLFAFDAAGIATFRALALVATQPNAQDRAGIETSVGEAGRPKDLPFLRACILESVRLWPTTPAIFRETTREVTSGGGRLPKHAQILVYVPFFHRDDENLPQAHRFAPELWFGAGTEGRWPLIPFSEGPGVCPAHHLVPMMGSFMMAAILGRNRIALRRPERLRTDRPMPGTLDNFHLRFALQPVDAGPDRR